MIPRVIPSRMEAVFLLLCAAILSWKLLLPGFIGMVDNGDFAKVAGPLSLGNAEPAQGILLHADYLRGRRYYYDSHVPSSEMLLAWMASALERTLGDPGKFNIRWLAAIHGLVFLAFYHSVLIFLRPLSTVIKCALSLVALWIFADIGLIAYLNSFYSDVPAALFGLAAIFIGGGLLIRKQPTRSALILFTLTAFLFITSKAQHAVLGFIPAGTALFFGWSAPDKRLRLVGRISTLILLAASAWMLGSTPGWYKAQARFNLIFLKILNHSPSPARDMEELGLVSDDARYIGLHSYVLRGPMENPAWADAFRARTNYGQEIRFYLRHPSRALAILRSDLEEEAPKRYSPGLASFGKQIDGPECPAAQFGSPECYPASILGSWSALRSWACRMWPAHLVLWFGVLLPGALVFALRRGSARPHRALACTIFAAGLMAVIEFAFSSLADACETARHLFMFHLFTDASIFLTLVAAAGAFDRYCRTPFRRLAAAACGAVILATIIATELARPAARNLEPISGTADGASKAVGYAGIWLTGVYPQPLGGTLTYSDRPGATARVCFEGTEFQYIYTKAWNRGLANVVIDGISHSVDLYDPGLVWQARTVFGDLKPGRHCGVVQVLGRHTTGSNGNFVDIEAFAAR